MNRPAPGWRRTGRRLIPWLALLVVSCAGLSADPHPAIRSALIEYVARLPRLREQIPAVSRSAEAAAAQMLEHPQALLDVPYWEQTGFSEELINRAGGLPHTYPTGAPGRLPPTPHDVVLLSVRSWEKDGAPVIRKLAESHARGWRTILIASRAGMPPDLPVDHFIDNGAPSGVAGHGRINALANVTLGWMWCCEYAAAMTRQGRIPAVLLSAALPEADAHNGPIQTAEGRHRVLPCDQPVPPGRLATLYLRRVERLVRELRSSRIQDQLRRAANIIAARMRTGGTVGASGIGHLVIFELLETDTRAPWKGFQTVNLARTAIRTNLKRGDLLFWVGYLGVNSRYEDYARCINEVGPDVITCHSRRGPPYGTVSNVLAHIDQSWEPGDAEVPLPCPPGRMAPISGLNTVLLYRMLDDEVAGRLANPTSGQPVECK